MPISPTLLNNRYNQLLKDLYGTSDPTAALAAARLAGTVRPGTYPGAPGGPGNPLTTVPPPPGTVVGAPPQPGGSPAAGRVPNVTDPTKTAADALAGNLANMPNLSTLFNQIGSTQIPGFEGLQGLESENIRSLLAGEFNVPEAFRRVAEMGTQMGPGGGQSDAYKTAEILFGRRMAEEAKAMGAKRFSDAITRSKGVLDLEKFLQTPEQRANWQWLANQLAAAPDPEAAFQRALALIREGITRGYNTSRGPLGGGGAPTTLTNPSNTRSIIQRFGGTPPGPGTTPPGTTGPGWGYISPSDGGEEDRWVSSGGLPYPFGMPPGGYSAPGDVPYWVSGDPMAFVNPNLYRPPPLIPPPPFTPPPPTGNGPGVGGPPPSEWENFLNEFG